MEKDGSPLRIEQPPNLLATISPQDLRGFQWLNPPDDFRFSDGMLHILAAKGSDFFNNPEDETRTATAPLLFTEVTGDFVATALVRPDFSSVWNAAALMIHIDSASWIKLAFENSDATGKSIVSVVTRQVSDDANGPILNDQDSIWLRIIKKNNLYALHWSKDGFDYKMARLAAMSHRESIKLGMEAQCPVGDTARHIFQYFSLEQRTVENLRTGQ